MSHLLGRLHCVPSILSKLVLFGSSAAPLLLVFGLLDTFGPGWPSATCIALCAFFLLANGFLFYRLAKNRLGSATKSQQYTVNFSQERGSDVMGYVATYLIPFAGFDASSWRGAIALLVFVSIIGILYIRTGLYAINPVLSVCGFKLYRSLLEINPVQERSVVVLSRVQLPQKEGSLLAHQLGPDLLIAFKRDNADTS